MQEKRMGDMRLQLQTANDEFLQVRHMSKKTTGAWSYKEEQEWLVLCLFFMSRFSWSFILTLEPFRWLRPILNEGEWS